LRPRLYSAARFAGSLAIFYIANLGLRPRLYSAARFAGSLAIFYIANLGLAPQVLFCRPLRGLSRTEIHRYHLNTAPYFVGLEKINGISMERIVID
jgi:hypothetical protein